MWLSDKARDTAAWIVGIATVALLLWCEILIRKEKLRISPTGIEYRKGKETIQASFPDIARYGARQTKVQNQEEALQIYMLYMF